MNKAKKRGPGRPQIEFDLEAVEGLGRIGATINDMVHVLPASKRTIADRMADPESDFRIAYERGRALLNSSLRRKQIAVAMAGDAGARARLGLGWGRASGAFPRAAEARSDRGLPGHLARPARFTHGELGGIQPVCTGPGATALT